MGVQDRGGSFGGRGNFDRGRSFRGGGNRGSGRGGFDRGGSRGGSFRGSGPSRGGSFRGRGGGRGAPSGVRITPHRHPGIFITKMGDKDMLATKSLVPGESVYGEKRVEKEDVECQDGTGAKVEYRMWNPFRSKLAAGILNGIGELHMRPGFRVLYLGAASGTTVSHVADVVGLQGLVYAVEFSHRSGRDLLAMAQKRCNIAPIVDDARRPERYRMLMGMVDCIFSDVAQPDQARIVCHNASYYLKDGGYAVISVKCSCIDSTAPVKAVIASEIEKLKKEGFKMRESISLEPYERDHEIIVAEYRPFKSKS